MRISDWSSDVCSSDLRQGHGKRLYMIRWDGCLAPTLRFRRAYSRCLLMATALIKSHLMARQSSLIQATSCRSEEHTSELQSLMRISYAVFCLKTNNNHTNIITPYQNCGHRKTF